MKILRTLFLGYLNLGPVCRSFNNLLSKAVKAYISPQMSQLLLIHRVLVFLLFKFSPVLNEKMQVFN